MALLLFKIILMTLYYIDCICKIKKKKKMREEVIRISLYYRKMRMQRKGNTYYSCALVFD
jgi:hypothetical protein